MTPDELKKRFPRASESFIRANCSEPALADRADPDHGEGKRPKLERPADNAAQGEVRAQEINPARYLIRLRNFRRRLLDEDNIAGKFHIDALRYSGVLPSDAPNLCKIELSQEKVERREDERVEITIWPPGAWQDKAQEAFCSPGLSLWNIG